MDSGAHRSRRPALYLLYGALVISAVASVAVTFAPWHHSGSAVRNSYDLLAAADRLGVLTGTARRALATAWAVLPFVAALSVVSLTLGARRTAAGLALTAGAVELVVSLVVMRIGDAAGWGAPAGAITGCALILAAIALVATGRETA